MNTTPKTDECIKMLNEATTALLPGYYSNKWFYEKEYIFDFQNRIRSMLAYRLMPFCIISIPDNADKETAKANPILQNISNFDAFWYAMKNYQLITADDLRDEFWSICPDLESIPKFLNAMNVKFNEVNCIYDTDIETIKEQYSGLNALVALGKITTQEADELLLNIHFIAERYNFIMCYIREIYKKFREMAEPQKDTQNVNTDKVNTGKPQQITIQEHILNELEKEKLITKEPLQWIGQKNLCAYFVDHYFKNQTKKWEIGKNLFGVDNLAQLKDLYENSKSGKPRGYKTIDKILKVNG